MILKIKALALRIGRNMLYYVWLSLLFFYGLYFELIGADKAFAPALGTI